MGAEITNHTIIIPFTSGAWKLLVFQSLNIIGQSGVEIKQHQRLKPVNSAFNCVTA